MIRRSDFTVADDGTTPRAGVFITVKTETGAIAALTDNSGSAKANPFISDTDGSFSYNVPDSQSGVYTEEYRLSLAAAPRVVRNVVLDNNAGLRKAQRSVYGRGDTAAVYSAIGGINYEFAAEINGPLQPASNLALFPSRDVATYYGEMIMPPILLSASGTFTATTFVPTAAINTADLEVGMTIDTGHSPKYSGEITGFAANGTSVTVSGWYQMGNTAAGQVPAGTQTAFFSPITKGWAINLNARVLANSYGNQASVAECGAFNERGAPNLVTGENCITIFDAVNLGTFATAYGYEQRGHMVIGYSSQDAAVNGFLVKNGAARNPTAGFRNEATTGLGFQDAPGGVHHWSVREGIMRLGRNDGTSGGCGIYLNSSGVNLDYDSRFYGIGGGGGVGQGSVRFAGAAFQIYEASEANGFHITGGTTAILEPIGTAANIPVLYHAKGSGVIQLGKATNALGFFGAGGNGKQTVTGSRGANAALASLLTSLANYGLITDSSTA